MILGNCPVFHTLDGSHRIYGICVFPDYELELCFFAGLLFLLEVFSGETHPCKFLTKERKEPGFYNLILFWKNARN